MLNCRTYDGYNRLVKDPQIVCMVGMHKMIALTVGVFTLVVWGFGIPLMIYLLMSKEKEKLNTTAAKIRFGFLYNGYKLSNYYWEIVIMYRKIFCLIIAVFLKKIGIII